MKYSQLVSTEIVNKTIEALGTRGITAEVVASGQEAKERVLTLIPEGAEVMTMTSITLESTGITEELNNSGKYKSTKNELAKMSRETQHGEMQKIGAAPEWVLGSVHAVTEDGVVVVASMTGSQLPAYSYGASHVIWVVGTQKIVANLDEANKRVEQYVLPLESERARKAYGLPESFNSAINKLFILNGEVNPDRIRIIFVNEQLGY